MKRTPPERTGPRSFAAGVLALTLALGAAGTAAGGWLPDGYEWDPMGLLPGWTTPIVRPSPMPMPCVVVPPLQPVPYIDVRSD